jgi:hypothetical protein
MRNLFRVIIGFFLVSSVTVHASEVKPFIGIDLSQASTSVKNTFSVTSGSFDYGSTNVPAGSSASASEDLNVSAKDVILLKI